MSDSNRLGGMSEEELVKRNSGAMKRLEAIWDEVARRSDARAGDDRLCGMAHASAEAEKIRASLTILHRQMDQFAATYGNVPIARTGER